MDDHPTPPLSKPSVPPNTMPITGGDDLRTLDVDSAAPSVLSPIADEAPSERKGDQIGPYTLVSPLGEGGFGSVWLAERRQPFVQRVALKIIKAGMDSGAVIARFEQERQTLAVMNHPNVARVLDGGLSPSGRPYFAMEYVKGQPITDYCDAHSLSTPQRLRLFVQACEAVQHAHTKGIIHRDLKPGNMMVTVTEGENPMVKVIDFGLAKALTQLDTDTIAVAESGKMVGTPEYMSPEQADSDSQQIDTRSDVYSLGVILYELICGLLPFDSNELRSKSYREIQRIVRDEAPPSVSARLTSSSQVDAAQAQAIAKARGVALAALVRDLKRELEWIPLKAMRKEPKNRYPTALAIAEDIGNYLGGKPLMAAPESTTYRVRKYVRRHMPLVSAAAAVLLALVAGLGLATWQWREATRARDAAEASEAKAVAERNAADLARSEATTAKDAALASEARALQAKEAADAARRKVEEGAYIANIQMGNAWLVSGDMDRLRERLDACPPKRRNWEWGWLDARSDGSLVALDGKDGEVLSAGFNPDGTRVLTVGFDRTVRVWDTATAQPRAQLKVHPGIIYLALFSPDGSRIVTACDDGVARLWDAGTGAAGPELVGHAAAVFDVAFNEDGTRVVTASADKTARVWNAATGASMLELKGHAGPVSAVAFSGDGARVITGSADQTARVWDGATGALVSELKGHAGPVVRVAFSADGTRVVTASADKTARVWDAASGALLADLKGHEDGVVSAGFSPDGSRVLTASLDRTGRIWDVASAATLSELRGHTEPLISAGYSADGRQVVTASRDRTARVWDAATGARIADLRGHAGQVFAASFSRDGNRVVTASLDGTARLWEASQPGSAAELGGHTALVYMSAFSPDGQRLVTASEDRTARVWDLSSGALVAELKGHGDGVYTAQFSPDGARVVTASGDRTARVWDATTGATLLELKGHAEPVRFAGFSPDGKRIVTASRDKTARLWDASTGAQQLELKGHGDRVATAAFSADGTRVATASRDKTARVWDAATGTLVAELKGHGDALASVAFSPDGTRVVTASADRTARIWDASTGALVAELKGHSEPLSRAVYSPDGSRIVTAGRDRTPRVWDASNGAPLLELTGHSEPVLSAAFSADGTRIVTPSADGTARVWDVATGTCLAELKGHRETLASATFSPDETRIATTSSDRTARIWDAVPRRVRFAEQQFARQGRQANLGLQGIRESHGEATPTWMSDPSRVENRPNFLIAGGASGLAPAQVTAILRAALAERRIVPALEAARNWGIRGVDPDVLNALAWEGCTGLRADDRARDLDQLLACAQGAVRQSERRQPSFLDTLARVHWERTERAKAAEIEREAIAVLTAQPAPQAAEARERRDKLLASMQASLARYEAPAQPSSPPVGVSPAKP